MSAQIIFFAYLGPSTSKSRKNFPKNPKFLYFSLWTKKFSPGRVKKYLGQRRVGSLFIVVKGMLWSDQVRACLYYRKQKPTMPLE